jgi:glutamine amidotransferase
MCRLAAYRGAPESLAALLYAPPHSLERQAYAPREMVSGHVNVDGTGVAWWEAGEPEPLRYVSDRPPWSDPNLPHLAARLRGSPIVAAVRSQTPGMPAGAAAAHPFTSGRWAGAHNGYLNGFEAIKWTLLERVAEQLQAQVETLSDSLLLFLMAVSRLHEGGTTTLAEAAAGAAEEAGRICAAAGAAASLNLVLADGSEVVALRSARGAAANSLYWIEGGGRWPEGALVASEPLDDDKGWSEVPVEHLVRLAADGVQVSGL